MAKTFDYSLDVNPRKLAWSFNGDRIHASIPKCVVARWRGNIFEFQMYVMRNFIVVGNKTKPRTTNSNWILMFFQRITVTHVNNPSYPLEAFRFRSISDLLNAERLDDTYLFDMIAEVVGKEDPGDLVTSTGKETKCMAVVLEDLENNRIGYTLFGEMVDQIRPHLEEGSVEPLIVVL
ncbi:uncharacterized protein LOC107636800 [Arachis ipaensis]|uniref:DUF223 domain-containing protein n=1 Tax=Arachis hypogaea TaxID=3818 RepID=A0A444ZKS7_ARAHY|nr:uncharacterized protein LOC107636800 [Arachis ipaensis]RYR14775.1 hypothetical protein Ahy_B04g071469 [Arachis hypogaea]